MTMPVDPNRPTGPLARVGQNDSFAGFTRLWMAVAGLLVAWAAFDVKGVLKDIKDNQVAIQMIGDRTTHLEGAASTAATNLNEFRLWTQDRVRDLAGDIKDEDKRLYAVETAEGKTVSRVACLEHHSTCPQ